VKIAFATAIGVLAAAGVLPSTGSGQAGGNTPPMTHEYADVNGVKLHYARAGHGPLIVFLHGFPEFWYEWHHQIAEFSQDHTVVAPDMRGYNLSSKPTELAEYAVPKLVEDVRALTSGLLKSTGGEKFTLVAHDWGGVVAWVFAAMHPQMLDALVIVNAPHPTIFGKLLSEDPAQQRASQYMLMFRGPQAEAALSANSYAMLTSMVLGAGLKDGTVTEADRKMYVDAWSQPGALTGGLNYYRASAVGPPAPSEAAGRRVEGPAAAGGTAARSGTQPAVSEAGGRAEPRVEAPALIVRVPTLVIWGEKDTALLTNNLEGLDRMVPTLTIKRVPEGTHWIVREKPAEVNRLIREFMATR
jgi:epoxide hydrolase 4